MAQLYQKPIEDDMQKTEKRGRVDAPVAKRSGWVSAKRELRSSRKAPRPRTSLKVAHLSQSCFYQLFWLFPISKRMGEKRRCARGTPSPNLLLHIYTSTRLKYSPLSDLLRRGLVARSGEICYAFRHEKVSEGASAMTELDKKLAKAARECSADAVRRTFEAGRPITILVGNRVVRRWADGHEELVEELPPR